MIFSTHNHEVVRLTFQFSRSLSTGNTTSGVGCVAGSAAHVVHSAVEGSGSGALPGSPYRAASTQILNLASSAAPNPAKHSLSKELMQKLRSMTETIKMLSDENEVLKRENDRIRY